MIINFCGGSHCASPKKESWTTLLANKLNAKIIGLGKSGAAHEHAIKSFNSTADITIFCWPNFTRLYNKDYSLTFTTCKEHVNDNKIYKAGYVYYKYLYDHELAKERQIRDLFWFDEKVLTNYTGTILHIWGTEVLYNFKNGSMAEQNTDKKYHTKIRPRANHMTYEDNIKYAAKITSFLTRY
jgi:hypothetical protein